MMMRLPPSFDLDFLEWHLLRAVALHYNMRLLLRVLRGVQCCELWKPNRACGCKRVSTFDVRLSFLSMALDWKVF